jgi:hypothetical protein
MYLFILFIDALLVGIGKRIEHDIDEVCHFIWEMRWHFGIDIFIVEFLSTFIEDDIDRGACFIWGLLKTFACAAG